MSTKIKSTAPAKPGTILTLSQVLDQFLAREDHDQKRRQEVASAFRSLAKALGRPMEAIPADPEQLRLLLADLTPAMAGVSTGRWRNIRGSSSPSSRWAS